MSDTVFGFLAGFLFGLIGSAGLFIGFGVYQIRRLKKIKATIEEQMGQDADDSNKKRESIRERLLKASEIMKRQVELRGHAEMPSANSAHSKYKNGLISEMIELENEKIAILQSILNDGFDPTITILGPDGMKEEMTLSQFLNNGVLKDGVVKESEAPKTAPTVKRVGKFVVHKGGKDDSGTTQ